MLYDSFCFSEKIALLVFKKILVLSIKMLKLSNCVLLLSAATVHPIKSKCQLPPFSMPLIGQNGRYAIYII
jgi:hypothetical protein